MAEGFARFLAPSNFAIYSAGSQPGSLNPLAVRAMKEVGIDISGQVPKSLADVPIKRVATIITLCSTEECPELPNDVLHVHCPLPDPAAFMGSEDDAIYVFREVRNSIRELVSRIF